MICFFISRFFEIVQLFFQVPCNDRFDSPGAGHNSLLTQYGRDETHKIATQPTQPIAFTFNAISALYFFPEYILGRNKAQKWR